MRIRYSIQSQGQGHLVRSATVIRALRARGHQIDVLVAGAVPPRYARALLGEYDLEVVPNFALKDGKLDVGRTLAAYVRSVPRRFGIIARLRRELVRSRTDLVITDFEPLSAFAAMYAGVSCVAVAGQYRITRTDCPAPRAPIERWLAVATIETWTPPLDRYLVVSFSPARPTRRRTEVIGPIVDSEVRDAVPTREGFRLAYLYTYPRERIVQALRPHGRFRVYGMGVHERDGDIEFCETDRTSFVRDLAACEGVVLNGSFQGVCEAAVLGKPILSIPFQGQYEERFNASLIESSGLGVAAPSLSAEAIGRLMTLCPREVSRCPPDGVAQLIATLGL